VLLAVLAASFWATLPIALKVALEVLDPWTLTWFRFLVAALLMSAWLAWRGYARNFRGLPSRAWILLVVAGVMLTANYVFYAVGLDYTTPANAQLLIQLAPFLMAFGGIVVFREPFGLAQWAGLGLMATGLVLFFSDQLAGAAAARYIPGSLLIVAAALVWAVYALAQKQLLVNLPSTAIMGFIYVAATLMLWPAADPAQLRQLDVFHSLALLYTALNTLAAYGAFAEALAHWEASRVSAVLALTPLFTVFAMEVTVRVAPDLVAPERITAIGWIGASLVVGGSIAVSLVRPGTLEAERLA
jgi:drug/metabolite transporter (DMT)-like permease